MLKQEDNTGRHKYWLLLQCEFWVYHVLVFCFSLYIIALLARADRHLQSVFTTSEHRYALETIDMWEKGYIIDIKVFNTDNCPESYSPLISYTWSGTVQGCYCSATLGEHTTEYIVEGSCSSELIGYGCTTVPPLDQEDLKMWKGGKLICYKRTGSLSFYNSTLENLDDGTAMQKCAQGQNEEVSMLPGIPCPVTLISNASISASQETLTLSDTQGLNFISEVGYPIADFKLTEYNFCKFFDEINISPGRNGNYVLENLNKTITCSGSDPRMKEFDYMTEEDFITNNTRVYDLIEQLPGYPRPSISYFYRLGFIAYPAWTHTCRTSSTHHLLAATTHLQFKELSHKSQLALYVGVPCMLLVAFLIRILYMARHIFQIRAKKEFNMVINTDEEVAEQIPNLNIVKSIKKQMVFFVLEVVLIMATLCVILISLVYHLSESQWVKSVFLKQCSDDFLNQIFRYYEDRLDHSGYLTSRAIVFVAVLLTLQISHLVIRRTYGDLKKKEEPIPEELSNEELMKDEMDEKHQYAGDSHLQLQDSSDVIIQRDIADSKFYALDNVMDMDLNLNGADETNINFYAQNSIEVDNVGVGKKKKKKKGIKRKNLFRELDDQKE